MTLTRHTNSQETMNEESSSKLTFRITLTCPLAAQSTYHLGEVKEIIQTGFRTSLEHWLSTHSDFVGLPAILTVLAVDNQSPSVTTKQPLPTKAPSLKNTMSAN